MKLLQNVRRVGALFLTSAVLAMSAIGPANATFTVPTEVTDAATSVGLVGAAVFAIAVGIKLYKWIKSAL